MVYEVYRLKIKKSGRAGLEKLVGFRDGLNAQRENNFS